MARRSLLGALIGGVLAACQGPPDGVRTPPRTAADSQAAHVAAVAAAGGTVDSILPVAVALARFRDGLDQVDTLRYAAASREALVDRWARAVSASDTATLNTLLVDRAEFAWLYYPGSRMSLPPYEAPPGLLWGQLLASSNEGASVVMRRFGGRSFRVTELRCPTPPVAEGENQLHERCEVRVGAAGGFTRLFGTIVERDGRFKFLGYANPL